MRFELTTLCSQSRYANRTALCPELLESKKEKSGERGIRTPGGVTLVGFQDRCHKPLGHLSLSQKDGAKVVSFLKLPKYLNTFFQKKSLFIDTQTIANIRKQCLKSFEIFFCYFNYYLLLCKSKKQLYFLQ